ncbi:MAG: elongation factor P hydroxylase [Pseudomonadota bacterium]
MAVAPEKNLSLSRETVPECIGIGFSPKRLERVFSQCFLRDWQTQLVGGAAEPVYQPAKCSGDCHLLYYREDYFASALHEVAHWCIAGETRRQQLDFGYWYAPDGRDAHQQKAFERVEVKPQALEWLFSLACGFPFNVSVDNLSVEGGVYDAGQFKRQVQQQAQQWQNTGLPRRGLIYYEALSNEFETGQGIGDLDLTLAKFEG